MNTLHLFTIGFTKKKAATFFELLQGAGVRRVIDTRLNNVSQLAGFTKRDDLSFFLQAVAGIDYRHLTDLAPTQSIFDNYKKHKGEWSTYEQDFLKLMQERQIEKILTPDLVDGACLLCSEATPHYCHRRLVAEYLNQQWGNIRICHL